MTDKDRIYRWLTQADLEQMLDEAFARGAKAMHQAAMECTNTAAVFSNGPKSDMAIWLTQEISKLPFPENKP